MLCCTQVPTAAEVYFDGTHEMPDDKWEYWKGPRFKGVSDKLPGSSQRSCDGGTTMNTANDPAAAGGLYGAAGYCKSKESLKISVPTLSFD
jgi:hypothetical protein